MPSEKIDLPPEPAEVYLANRKLRCRRHSNVQVSTAAVEMGPGNEPEGPGLDRERAEHPRHTKSPPGSGIGR